jgi:hypothetical protein
VIKVVYASEATHELAAPDLIGLLEESRDRNLSLGITGLLIYAHGRFLQQLEGDDAAVDAVFQSIANDPRNTNLRLLSRTTATDRRFAGWWMGFDHPDDLTLAGRLPGFKASTRYPLVDPDLIVDATVAETLLALYGRNP